jgi:hypothetical protein
LSFPKQYHTNKQTLTDLGPGREHLPGNEPGKLSSSDMSFASFYKGKKLNRNYWFKITAENEQLTCGNNASTSPGFIFNKLTTQ